MTVRALILLAPGTNRAQDLIRALERVSVETKILPLDRKDYPTPENLDSYQALFLPGGFTYRDLPRPGVTQAKRLAEQFPNVHSRLLEGSLPAFGICNGFQTLNELGVFPNLHFEFVSAAPKRFFSREMECELGLGLEGARPKQRLLTNQHSRFVLPVAFEQGFVHELRLIPASQKLLHYRASLDDGFAPEFHRYSCAGVCSSEGRIWGVMPHPENGGANGLEILRRFCDSVENQHRNKN